VLRQASSIINATVLELENGNALGRIRALITNYSGNKILAFVLRFPSVFQAGQVLAPIDVVEYGSQIVITRNRETIIRPNDIAGLEDLIRGRIAPLGKLVLTPTGKRLGVVDDLVLEENGTNILKYHLRPGALALFANYSLVLPADQVIRIEKDRVIANEESPKKIKGKTIPQSLRASSTSS